MTPNGKIDHAALPEPERVNTVADDVSESPATDTQRRIAEIVAGLLDRTDIGLEDNFFMLGGHSLLGAQLIARLRNTFGVEIGLRSLFTAPTVAALSVEIERLASKKEALKTPERAPACGAPQPCTTAASFQAKFAASLMPVFMPKPPVGVKRCAASPARNTRPRP